MPTHGVIDDVTNQDNLKQLLAINGTTKNGTQQQWCGESSARRVCEISDVDLQRAYRRDATVEFGIWVNSASISPALGHFNLYMSSNAFLQGLQGLGWAITEVETVTHTGTDLPTPAPTPPPTVAADENSAILLMLVLLVVFAAVGGCCAYYIFYVAGKEDRLELSSSLSTSKDLRAVIPAGTLQGTVNPNPYRWRALLTTTPTAL